jgi:hypothetical protein
VTDVSITPEILTALGNLKFSTLAAIASCFFFSFLMWLVSKLIEKWLDMRTQEKIEKAKSKRAEQYVKASEGNTAAINRLVGAQEHNNALVTDLATTNKSVLATLRGVINPADSRKIIEAELWSVAKESVRAFQISLRDNHFKGRESYIEAKMRRSVMKLMDRALRKLQSFDMALSPRYFFAVLPDGITYVIESQIWCEMHKLYLSPVKYDKGDDGDLRDRTVFALITGIIRDELARAYTRSDNKEYLDDSGFYAPDSARGGGTGNEESASGLHSEIGP